MQKILVDTTIWVDYLNGKRSEKVEKLLTFMKNDEPICLSPTIIQEVLQGIKSDQEYVKIHDLLFGYIILVLDPLKSAIEATQLYRKLRKTGITVRKSTDCLIAYYAIANNAVLLQNDRDFEQIAKHSELRLV